MSVQSEVGKGTSVHVYFPLVEGQASTKEAVEDSTKPPKGEERILLVDDETSGIEAVQPMLEWLGYRVTTSTSSLEALEAFRENPGGFDLVITDQTMPDMTGRDLAKELMSIRPDIPIILYTGFSEQIDEKMAKKLGIKAFLMKPIVVRQIADTIREVLEKGG